MAVTLYVPVDQLTINQLIDDGFTTLTLWYADEPDGTFADSGITPDPATLAAAVTDETYTFTFSYSGGSPAQWFKIRGKQGSSYSDSFLSSAFQGGAGVTLKYLRRRLGYMLGDMTVATGTTNGSTTTAVSATFPITRWPDDYFAGGFIYRPTSKEDGSITASAQSTGTITFSPAHGALVASAEEFEITKRWTHSDYVQAINWACIAAYPVLSRPIINTGVLTEEDVQAYTIPHDVLRVAEVEVETYPWDTATADTVGIRGYPWQKLPGETVYDGLSASYEINQPEYLGKRVRIKGQGYLSQMSLDADSTECQLHNAELLLTLAGHRLYWLAAQRAASSDRDFFTQQAQVFWQKYQEQCISQRSHRAPGRVWSDDAKGSRGRARRVGVRGGGWYPQW